MTITLFDSDHSLAAVLTIPPHATAPTIVRILAAALAIAKSRNQRVSVSGLDGRLVSEACGLAGDAPARAMPARKEPPLKPDGTPDWDAWGRRICPASAQLTLT